MSKWVLAQERSEKWQIGMTFFPGVTYAGLMSKAVGADYEELVGVFGKGGSIKFYLPSRNMKIVSHYCLQQLDEDPFLPNKLLAKFTARIPKLEAFAREAQAPSFTDKTSEELGDWYEKFNEKYWDAYVYSEPFAFAVQDILSERLEAVLRVRLRRDGAEEKFGEYFTILTAMREKAFASREEESLLRIAAKIKENDELVEDFRSLGVEKLVDKLRGEPVWRVIEAHENEFYWVPFDYNGETWDSEHFVSTLKELFASRLDVGRRLAEIKAYYDTLSEKQSALETRLGFNEHERQLFAASRTLTWIMDFKKECFTKTHYCARSLLDEAAKRLELMREQVYWATPPEIVARLRGERVPTPATLSERSEFCVFNCRGSGGKGSWKILTSGQANEFLKKEGLLASSPNESFEVKGVCASAGNAIGEARIVRKASELGKLKKGDILITIMTTPDFVVGMKRAAAIVTDEGGVTCHAAIVSREMGIPCVVGTGNATKVFKDGDVIEVRAQHGIAKKIK